MNISGIRLFEPEQRDNPHPVYEMFRRVAPVLYLERADSWVIFRYDDARTVLRDPQLFSSASRRPPDADVRFRPSMLGTDPPRHTQLRELVNRAFTPRMVAALEPRITAITHELLDQVIPNGQMDVVEDLAYPLPIIVIAEMLGIPPDDRAMFRRWSDAIIADLNGAMMGSLNFNVAMQEEIRAYFLRAIEEHRADPRDDLISALLAAEIEGQYLDVEDILSFCVLLLVAGNETTRHLIANAVRCFLDHPEALARLYEEPALLPSAIEEVLRFRSPAQMTGRTATADTEIRGKRIKAGQGIIVLLAAANRDPAEFPDPDRFDITREPNRHLAFGLGPHFCLGAPLARLEARIALGTLLDRAKNLRYRDDRPLELIDGFVLHGLKHLPVAFEAAA